MTRVSQRHRLPLVAALVAVALATVWGNDRANAAAPLIEAAAISGPRDLLRRHGIDDARFETLADGRPVDAEELDVLWSILYWMRDFRPVDAERWSQGGADLARMAARPEDARGQLYHLSGRIQHVAVCPLPPEAAERLEMSRYYRCEVALDPPGRSAVLFSADVPKAWPENAQIDEPIEAYGLFVKLIGDEEPDTIPLFLTSHVAWHPPTLLGSLGMDVALRDHVVDRVGLGQSRRIEPAEVARAAGEREAFYAMLAAVSRAKPGQLDRDAARRLADADAQRKWTDSLGNERFAVAPLFIEPEANRWQLVTLTGWTRRVARIEVDDADIVARYGIDHYYEVSMFTPDSGVNPLIVCVRELPEGMRPGDAADYHESIRVAGFLFKLWSYRIEAPEEAKASGANRPVRQPAPLLVARDLVWIRPAPPSRGLLVGSIAGGLFVVALLGVWFALWRTGRADRRFHDRAIAKTRAMSHIGQPTTNNGDDDETG